MWVSSLYAYGDVPQRVGCMQWEDFACLGQHSSVFCCSFNAISRTQSSASPQCMRDMALFSLGWGTTCEKASAQSPYAEELPKTRPRLLAVMVPPAARPREGPSSCLRSVPTVTRDLMVPPRPARDRLASLPWADLLHPPSKPDLASFRCRAALATQKALWKYLPARVAPSCPKGRN